MNAKMVGTLFSLVLLITFSVEIEGWGNTCYCTVMSPRQTSVARFQEVSPCSPVGSNECTCESRLQECFNYCTKSMSYLRPSSTTNHWKSTACGGYSEEVPYPGLPMWVESESSSVDGCPDAGKQRTSLPTKLLCCRASYGRMIPDGTCSWN